jgi:hypothetical protein
MKEEAEGCRTASVVCYIEKPTEDFLGHLIGLGARDQEENESAIKRVLRFEHDVRGAGRRYGAWGF